MDHRSVPLDVLREFVRSYAELTSLRTVAEDAGVGRSTVHKFVAAGTNPHPRVRRLLALWYLRRLAGFDEMEVLRPYVSALSVLLAHTPDSVRSDATLDVLGCLERRSVEAGEDVPGWIPMMGARVMRTRPVV
ncbi:MAG TPA: hypothetical protein VLK84_19000 [Longimicrobium sp.]|nr:hypothetical protein [Longimicrobium sp.]